MASQAAMLLTSGLVPHFAELSGSGDLTALRRSYMSLTRLVALAVFPLSLAFAAAAPTLVPLLYGGAFEDAVPTATALAMLASLSAANVGSAMVYGREKSWFVAASGIVGAVLAIVGGLVIVPTWGPLGAAASRAIVQTCMIGVGTWYIRTQLACPFPWLALLKTMAASAVAAGAGRAIINLCPGLPGLALAFAVIGLLYAALVRWLGLFHKDDALIVHRMVPALPNGISVPVRRATDWLAGLAYQDANHLFVQ
jgi:O-antigen/teichoic acid export membrane protein